MKHTALEKAIDDRDIDAIKRLISSGEDINQSFKNHGLTPLRCAINWNQGLKYLLKHGADADIQSEESGVTALMEAAGRDFLKATQILIEAGADVNLKDNGDATALWRACSSETKTAEKIAFMLLDAGADVRGGKTRPVIIIAAGCSTSTLLQRLIDEGADVNVYDEIEICPLYMALVYNNKKNLAVLLEAGADPLTVVKPSKKISEGTMDFDHFGKNMIEVAQALGMRPMAKMLEEAAAKQKK